MTLLAANALVRECDALFKRAALAWERGQNSGNNFKAHEKIVRLKTEAK